jgi:hypothetical protein
MISIQTKSRWQLLLHRSSKHTGVQDHNTHGRIKWLAGVVISEKETFSDSHFYSDSNNPSLLICICPYLYLLLCIAYVNVTVPWIFQRVCIGYPLHIVICSALGADMYYCVYPTQTACIGTALMPQVGKSYLYQIWQSVQFNPLCIIIDFDISTSFSDQVLLLLFIPFSISTVFTYVCTFITLLRMPSIWNKM